MLSELLLLDTLPSSVRLYLPTYPRKIHCGVDKSSIGPAHEALTLRQQTFTGSPRFDEHGKEYIPVHSPSLRYIGSEADVDAAWNKLMESEF